MSSHRFMMAPKVTCEWILLTVAKADKTADLSATIESLPSLPGVYRFFDSAGKILYVGKAVHLKKRVASYFVRQNSGIKTSVLVEKIVDVQFTVTNSEVEALLLEQTLIKSHSPPYNILLKDDKSYPYIYLSTGEAFPRLNFHRGAAPKTGRLFGPFVNGSAVREAINLLQKVFLVRQCDDSFFRNRSRPCLQHQIKRCSAPCVGLIAESEYQRSIEACQLFLEGKSDELIADLVVEMEAASHALEFEKAALLRDQINALRLVQSVQYVAKDKGNADAIAVVTENGWASVGILQIRRGVVVGHQPFLLPLPKGVDELRAASEQASATVLESFIPQYYLLSQSAAHRVPPTVLTSQPLASKVALEAALSKKAGFAVQVQDKCRQDKAAWLKMCLLNASEHLNSHLSHKSTQLKRIRALGEDLQIAEVPQRIECFDISHTGGELTVASCVVFDQSGPRKSDYRRFNIEGITPGDDYEAIALAVFRRYRRLKAEEKALPDVIVIDGGKGQINKAAQSLAELQIDQPVLISVAKGSSRRVGLETIYRYAKSEPSEIRLGPISFGLITHIRDEAHRFAITGHKTRLANSRRHSTLQDIPGVGPKRRKALITQFGGLAGLKRATVEELVRIDGISEVLAKSIYDFLHSV